MALRKLTFIKRKQLNFYVKWDSRSIIIALSILFIYSTANNKTKKHIRAVVQMFVTK